MQSVTTFICTLCIFLPAVVTAAGVGGKTSGYLYTLDDNFMINRTEILANGSLGQNTVFLDNNVGGKCLYIDGLDVALVRK